MKHGKRPTKAQKIKLAKLGLNPDNWLIVKDCRDCFQVVNRDSGKPRSLKRGVV